jgi:hypothetical protein
MSPADKEYSLTHQLLLTKFGDPRDVPSNGNLSGHSVEEWGAVLGLPLSAATSEFVSLGLLREPTIGEKLQSLLKVPDLKGHLRQRGMPVSGKKSESATRLAQSDPQSAQSLTQGRAVYASTEDGSRLIRECQDAGKASRTRMEESLADLLARGEFRKAVVDLASFEAAQVFPRGMGIDWAHLDPEPMERRIRLIFTRVPKSLIDTPSEYLPICRVGAAMFVLVWNVGEVSTWISRHIPGETEERLCKIAQDLHSHACFLDEIDTLESFQAIGGLYRLRVHASNDDHVCASCKHLAEGTHPLENSPEIPNPDCSSESWCRRSVAGELL